MVGPGRGKRREHMAATAIGARLNRCATSHFHVTEITKRDSKARTFRHGATGMRAVTVHKQMGYDACSRNQRRALPHRAL